MMTISNEDLAELTKRINARFDEFSVGGGPIFEPVTLGIVRLVYGVIAEWQEETEPATHNTIMGDFADDFALSTMTPPAYSNGHGAKPPATSREARAPIKDDPLSVYANSTLGPEHVVVTPLKPTPPDPDVAREKLANALANGSGGALEQAMDRDKKAEQLRAIIYELQDMAVDEVMPSMNFWNSAKPPHLPLAAALLARHNLTWNRLAEYAKLESRAQGQKVKVKVATRALADDADGEGEP